LGEDDSDIETLKVLIRRLADDQKIAIRGKGFDGCGKLLKEGWKYLKSLPELSCSRFVIAHDADQRNSKEVEHILRDKIIKPSGVETSICLLVPVQEIEAWLLADVEAVSNIFKGWKPKPETNSESKPHPKEYLEKLSRDAGGRPRYLHAIHNQQLAKHINLGKVSKSCPSFRPLEQFVKLGKGNY
jgi:hypothetical protein